MAKLLFYTKQSQLRFFIGPLVGGGNFRFLGYPDAGATCVSATPCYSDFKDTIAAGPFLAGAAGGLYYEAAKSISLVIEINEIAGLPTFGLVTDVNFALQFNIYSAPPPKPAAGACADGFGSRRAKIISAEAGTRASQLRLGLRRPRLAGGAASAGRPRWRRSAWLRSARPVAASQRIAPAA